MSVSVINANGWRLGMELDVEVGQNRCVAVVWPSGRPETLKKGAQHTAGVDGATFSALLGNGDGDVKELSANVSLPHGGIISELSALHLSIPDGEVPSEIARLASVSIKSNLLHRMLTHSSRFCLSISGMNTLVSVSKVAEVSPVDGRGVKYYKVTPDTLVSFMKNSKSLKGYQKLPPLGGLGEQFSRLERLYQIPDAKGAVLFGLPGTGKTLLARHLARGVDAPLVYASGADVIPVSSVAGEIEANVAKIFADGRRLATSSRAIVLLDEIDSLVGRNNDSKDSMVAAIERRLTSALCAELDDRHPSQPFVIATTNRQDSLDMRFRRRLSQAIEIPPPTAEERVRILEAMANSSRIDVDRDALRQVGLQAHGYVGADIAGLWREAAYSFTRRSSGANTTLALEKEDLFAGLRKTKPSAMREVSLADSGKVGWADVGGQELAKKAVKEVVNWSLDSEMEAKWAKMGVRPPRGLLLFGPPGCSKTLLARAVAADSQVNFISIKGPELLSKWVGDSEKAVRATFKRARAAAPAVVFFDEIDALATRRESGASGAGGAEERVLAQLLTELDGVDSLDSRVVVIAATNRPDLVDTALLRPGRMDRLIYVGLPDAASRVSILQVHTMRVPLGDTVNLEELGKGDATEGMSGAELSSLVREATLAAMAEDPEKARVVEKRHFESALKRVKPRTPASLLQFYETYKQSARGVIIDS